MNAYTRKSITQGTIFLILWLVSLIAGILSFFGEEGLLNTVDGLAVDELFRFLGWILASVILLALALKRLFTPFLK